MKEGWEVEKLEKCLEKVTYTNKIHRKDFKEQGDYPVVSQEKDLINGYWNNEIDLFKVEKPIVVFGDHTQVKKYIDFDFVLGADGVKILKPKKHIDSKYFYYYLLNTELRSLGYARHYRLLKKVMISYPKSLPEQQRIVSILDHCFEAIDKAKGNAEQNLQNAKELFESYIQSLFEDEKWERKSIEDVCNAVFAGGDAPRNNMSKELTDKYQIPIYANAVKDRGLYGYTDVARVNKPSITIAGRGSGTGHTEIRTEPFLPIVRLIVCEPDTNQIILEFLKYSIDNLVIDISGSAIPQLTIPMIKKYEIPIASLDEQIKIVEKLEELKEQTQQLQSHYQKKLFDLEELKQSILQKAFAGELKTEKMVEETPLAPISKSVCCEAEKI